MGRRTAWLMISLCVLLAPCRRLRADESPDGPAAVFQDELIDRLAGDWNLTRRIRGREAVNRVDASWVLHHQFLQIHMIDIARPPTYEALLLIGYSHAEKRYVAHWMDTYGGHFSAIGYGTRSGDSIEFKFDFSDGPFFNTFRWDPAARGWTCRLENASKDGKRTLFAEDTLRRP